MQALGEWGLPTKWPWRLDAAFAVHFVGSVASASTAANRPFPNPEEPYKGWKVLANVNWPAGSQMYTPTNYGTV